MSQHADKDKSPVDTFNELKTLVVSYAKQETKDPLAALGKWVAFGLAGAVLLSIGLAYLAFGILRLVQSEVTALDDGLSFLPYLITCAALAVAIGLAAWAMTRTFSDDA